MDNTESIVQEIFKNEIQIKRITKGNNQVISEFQLIEQLKQEDFKVTLKPIKPNIMILVEMPPVEELNQEKPITFAIYLDNKFPFVFPRIHILSHLTKPTMADGRDYIEEIIHQQWSPSILLNEIIKSFPEFLKTIRSNVNNKEYLQSIGKHYQDQEYDVNMGLEDAVYYPCKEIVSGKQQPKTLQLTNSFILTIENQLLTQITATKDILQVEQTQNNIKLTWRTTEGLQKISTFTASNQEQLFNLFLSCKAGSSGKKIQEEDVTMQKFADYQIDDLLKQVNQNEENLQSNLNKVSLNQLMESYQQAIEYYSAYSDEDYKQYVQRLQQLLGREDVQKVLASPVQ